MRATTALVAVTATCAPGYTLDFLILAADTSACILDIFPPSTFHLPTQTPARAQSASHAVDECAKLFSREKGKASVNDVLLLTISRSIKRPLRRAT